MKILRILFYLVFASIDLQGQQFTYFFDHKVFNAQNVCDVQYTGCDWRHLSSTSNMLAYMHHPSGNLWLVLDELYDPDGYRRINIYNTNIETCEFTLLYTINLPLYWSCNAGANVDFQGRLYLRIDEWDPLNVTTIRTISRIADPTNPTIERLMILEPDQYAAEMLILNNAIYIADFNKPYVRVYDNSFTIMDTLLMPLHITGLTSVSNDCDSLTVYAAHCGYQTEEYVNLGYDTTLYISYYNLQTNTLTPICDYWMGDNVISAWATSPQEFLASDPECDLLIDLDRDNSTGVYPYDYLDSNRYCTMLEVPIADEDTYIHTSAPLDSIRLILSGILDAGDETLTMQPITAGFTFTMVNDSTFLITSINPTDSLYALALRSIAYQHTGTSLSAGIRTIIVQGFNDIKEGVLVKSFIQIQASDETLLFSTSCMSSDTGMFVTIHNNQFGCDSVVIMTVSLVPADTTILTLKTCDIAQVGSIENLYLNQDGCDSLVISQTSLYMLPELQIEVISDYNGYAISCFGYNDGSVQANVIGTQPWTYTWSTGHEDQALTGLSAGTYNVTVIDGNGCITSEEVTLIDPSEFEISFVVSEPGCFDHQDGSITVEQTGGVEPVQYSINESAFQSSPLFNGLGGGTYTINAIDANGCDVIEIIWINVPLELVVDLGEDQMIIVGDTAILNATVNIPFDSLAGISWSGLINPDCPNCLTQSVTPIVTTTYSVSITNNAGCMDEDSLTLILEYGYDIYIPNIFSPNGDGFNDLFLVSGGPEIKAISSFLIFDRWGSTVYSATNFEINDQSKFWDGKLNEKYVNPGVFAYKIIIEFQDGSSKIEYGDITLVR